jgi:hypothetical protein
MRIFAVVLVLSVLWPDCGSAAPKAPKASSTGSAEVTKRGMQQLHDMAPKLLAANPKPTRSGQNVRTLRAALQSLRKELVQADSDPSVAKLRSLRQQHDVARRAFAVLKEDLRSNGADEAAADLEAMFQPIWADIDGALTSSVRRPARLEAARARIDAALAKRSDPHGAGVTLLPLDSQR